MQARDDVSVAHDESVDVSVDVPPSLDTLPIELLALILATLPPSALNAVAESCSALHAAGIADEVWRSLLSCYFPDVVDPPPEVTARHAFAHLAFSQPLRSSAETRQRLTSPFSCPCEIGCGGDLETPDGRRCPCVAARTSRLPLRLGAFDRARAGSSALSSGGFQDLLGELDWRFDLTVNELPTLEAAALAQLHLLIICTTEGPALSNGELAALREWVEAGGALIVSAFSNWSAYDHYAADTVGWLGVRTLPRTRFLPAITHRIQPTDEATRALCTGGPFGPVGEIRNVGESLFDGEEAVRRHGAMWLEECQPEYGTLLHLPPSRAEGSVTGRGRVLVCSNYHWLADKAHWQGGTFASCEGCQRLLLNFVAAAVAARVAVGRA